MAGKNKNKRAMDDSKFIEPKDNDTTEPNQEPLVVEHTAETLAAETLPLAAFKAETIDVQAQFKMVAIPKGTVAYEITDKDGNVHQGFNKPKGVMEIKKYTEMTGGTMQIFDSETTIQVPIGFSNKFGSSQKCKNC